MKFFFDNNLPPKLALALHELVRPEHEVIHLVNLFAPNAEDAHWMGVLATQPGWIIITGDLRIGRNPHELRAWKEAGHTVFFLKPGWINLNFWIQAYKLTKCFPDIIAAAESAQRGSAFFISANGKIEAA